MTTAPIYNTNFHTVKDTASVAEATDQMLTARVSDLPVVDDDGKFVGMFSLERLFAVLLPKAASMDYGMPDLAFMSDTIEHLRRRMREIENRPVREFVEYPEHIAHPETSPLEILLLLYKGANAVPVVSAGNRELVGVATARDVLSALRPKGAA
jgi:CBS-domain-containing membrane protein